MTWVEKTQQAETWGSVSASSESWLSVSEQSETWSQSAATIVHVFDPYIFDRLPVFDTGSLHGIWDAGSPQSESWATA